MRRKFVRHFTAIVTLLAAAIPAFSWHDEGHKITGYIAWQRMTPQARETAVRILRAAPEDAQISALYSIYGIEPEAVKKMEFFMWVPTWADAVRERSLPVRNRKYHHSNWHYYDTFWRDENGKAVFVTVSEEGGQALPQLKAAEKTLRDPKAPDADKAIALAWFLHLAGDLHQPLHNSARVTEREPKGDQGGNLFLLTPEGTPREKQYNLHSFWDGIVIRSIPLKEGQCELDYLSEVGDRMMKKHRYDELTGVTKLSNYEAWHQEGLNLAIGSVFTADLKRFEMPSTKYQKAAFELSQRQIALAGYRIADTLNSIFSTPPVVTNTTAPN